MSDALMQSQVMLVVDDDEESRSFICRAIGHAYPVQFAACGEEALNLMERTPFAAIVLDIMMPGKMDGLTTFCELRKRSATVDTPVIILTGLNTGDEYKLNMEDMLRHLGIAPSVILEKPVDPQRFLQTVNKEVQK